MRDAAAEEMSAEAEPATSVALDTGRHALPAPPRQNSITEPNRRVSRGEILMSTHNPSPLNSSMLLGIGKNKIDAAMQENWLELFHIMNDDPDCYEAFLRNLLQMHADSITIGNVLTEVKRYFNLARRVMDQYLYQLYPGNDEARRREQEAYLPEVMETQSLLDALNLIYGSSLLDPEARMFTTGGDLMKKERRKIFEVKQLLGIVLRVRDIVTDTRIINRQEDANYFEDVLLPSHLRIMAREKQLVEARFTMSERGICTGVHFPGEPQYESLEPNTYRSCTLYRVVLRGRTSFKSWEQKTVTAYCFPGNGDPKRFGTIMNFKTLRSLVLKDIRNEIYRENNENGVKGEIYDYLRASFMGRTDEEQGAINAILETGLNSTINSQKFGRNKKGYSGSGYTVEHRTVRLSNELKEHRRFYVELRLGTLVDCFSFQDPSNSDSHTALKQKAMSEMKRALRPHAIYG